MNGEAMLYLGMLMGLLLGYAIRSVDQVHDLHATSGRR